MGIEGGESMNEIKEFFENIWGWFSSQESRVQIVIVATILACIGFIPGNYFLLWTFRICGTAVLFLIAAEDIWKKDREKNDSKD